MRKVWKLWYRLKRWWRYRSYYKNLPENPLEYVGTTFNKDGEEVGHVAEGIKSRPIPQRTDVSSKYGKRICRTTEEKGRGLIDEDLAITGQ